MNNIPFTELYDAFVKYEDQFGLTSLSTSDGRGHTTQNGALFTMEYLICLASRTQYVMDIEHEVSRIEDAFKALEKYPGISVRYPGCHEGESMDNAGSLLTFSALYGGREFAKRMYDHGKNLQCTGPYLDFGAERNIKFYKIAKLLRLGRQPKNFWNNDKPNEFCIWGWFGRSPGFMSWLKYCATGKMNPWDAGWIFLSQFIGLFTAYGDTDAKKLPYVNWQLLKNKDIFWKLSYKLWCWILMRKYKEGMKEVFSLYYRDAEHPIRKYSLPFIP